MQKLASEETKEDPRRVQIKALGKEPDCQAPQQLSSQVSQMWGPGQRTNRKDACLTHALIYLLGRDAEDAGFRTRVLASRTGVVATAAQYLAVKWEEELRPKSWIDQLTPEQQAEWIETKRRYSESVRQSNQRLAVAREAYDKAQREEAIEQATQRELMNEKLRAWGILLDGEEQQARDPVEQLARELHDLGIITTPFAESPIGAVPLGQH